MKILLQDRRDERATERELDEWKQRHGQVKEAVANLEERLHQQAKELEKRNQQTDLTLDAEGESVARLEGRTVAALERKLQQQTNAAKVVW